MTKEKLFTVHFKSKTDFCLSYPPRIVVITKLNDYGNMIARKVSDSKSDICPQCGKPWSNHDGYNPPPNELNPNEL